MNAITVYCSSSSHIDESFSESARIVGDELARRGITVVFGGGSVGLMGEIARATQHAGGSLVGVITRHLADREIACPGCDEMIVVDTMRERKKMLAERGDAFLILPGGIGTMEEFFEILVGRLLNEHSKPIGILNEGGFYDPLLDLIAHGIEHRFVKPAVRELFIVHDEPVALIDALISSRPVTVNDDQFLPMGGTTSAE